MRDNDPIAGVLIAALEAAAGTLRVVDQDPALALARGFGFGGFIERRRGAVPSGRDERLVRQFRDQLLVEAATELSQALAAADVPHFFARGMALLGSLYEPGDREMADIDLFVTPAAEGRTREVLGRCGYEELPSEDQSGAAVLRSSVDLAREGRSEVEAIAVELHWGLTPVDRLLPRPDTLVPDLVWDGVLLDGPLPVPAPAHHAALIVHHLVHHDLLHVRGFLDLALLRHRVWTGGGDQYEAVARCLGVLRAARVLHWILLDTFGFTPLPGIAQPPRDWRGRRMLRDLSLRRWLTWAGAAREDEHTTITLRRIGRRLILLDRLRDGPGLLADALWPPREHLRWRWPDAPSDRAAWGRHLRLLAGKMLRG
ncbi:MAG: hypothetical protein GTN62_05365 [Gemmatimonadales bacterium]|nr:hypothetical protein [Gemmatimonadales bacterium]NIN10928.1 hypothetical protein [Gemmatimonadales bacterium]NIN49526.1 hypothetical protein [Gemmatimonadales bacterium]NIP06990.1 hypothetical protein [Gemmatimonadales bacterium]NIQ99049.1 hypothetical protein [Gemmatimonadales bacterium]